MKIFFAEHLPDYKNYSFPYQVLLLREKGDYVDEIYNSGFLPMRNEKNIFYLARSVRVELNNFELSSENRRIIKKTENFESDMIPLSEFKYSAYTQKLCKTYADERFGEKTFSTEGIKKIFSGLVYNYVFIFKNISNQEEVGYSVCFVSGSLIQYAHSFYNLSYLEDNLGARMILEAVNWGKINNKKFAYLGTCYESSALYKTEFKGVEYFNGFKWSSSIDELKDLINRKNKEYLIKDTEFMEKHYQSNFEEIVNKFGIPFHF